MKEKLRELIKELAAIDGISGQEQKVVRAVLEHVRPLADEVSVDVFGNIIAVRQGGLPGPGVLIAAHTDEIGAIVKSVEKNGWIRFEKIGGTGDALLLGRQVSVNGHFGIVGAKSGHFMTAKERTEVKPHSELYIDVGCNSDGEVAALGIAPGDQICHWPYYNEFSDKDLLCSKALDDRVGCAILIQLLIVYVTFLPFLFILGGYAELPTKLLKFAAENMVLMNTIIFIAAAVILALSYFISVRVYSKRDF